MASMPAMAAEGSTVAWLDHPGGGKDLRDPLLQPQRILAQSTLQVVDRIPGGAGTSLRRAESWSGNGAADSSPIRFSRPPYLARELLPWEKGWERYPSAAEAGWARCWQPTPLRGSHPTAFIRTISNPWASPVLAKPSTKCKARKVRQLGSQQDELRAAFAQFALSVGRTQGDRARIAGLLKNRRDREGEAVIGFDDENSLSVHVLRERPLERRRGSPP